MMYVAWGMCALVVLGLFATTIASQRRGWGEAKAWAMWLFPVSQAGLFAYWHASTATLDLDLGIYLLAFVIGVLCCIADWFLFVQLKSAAARAGEVERVRVLEERAEAQRLQLEAIGQQQEEAGALRESITAELRAAREALAAGDGGRDKLSAAEETIGTRSQRYCQNQALDALLAFKIGQMEASGISVVCDVSIPADLPLPSTELCAVFSNLLDNATHATESLPPEERRVEIKAAVRANTLVVRMDNSYAEDAAARPNRRKKNDGAIPEHGWGLSILKAIADRHDGFLETEQHGTLFRTTLTLSL